MRDLDLWLALVDDDMDVDVDLARLIEEFAELRWHRRLPFLARLAAFATHPDPKVRVATLRAFAGCDGLAARRQLVDALDDLDADVRAAAIDSIAAIPNRSVLAHAMFHPNVQVRQSVIPIAMRSIRSGRLQRNHADLPLYLLADNDCRSTVEEHLAEARFDSLPLSMLITMHQTGSIDDVLARKLVLKSDSHGLLAFIRDDLAADNPNDSAISWLIELFWDEGDPDAEDQSSSQYPLGLFTYLQNSLTNKNGWWINQRFVSICKSVADGRGHWNLRAARIVLLAFAPQARWLYEQILPADVFRSALAVFYESGMSREEVNQSIVDDLLRLPCCRRPSGQLDLWVIGAILHLRRRDGFARLLAAYRTSQIAAGFDECPEESVRLLSYPGSAKDRGELIDAVFAKRGKDPFSVAVMMCSLPADDLNFAKRLTAHEAVKTLQALYDLVHQHGWTISPNKSSAIAHQISKRLMPRDDLRKDAFAKFLCSWLGGDWDNNALVDQVFIDSTDPRVRALASFSVATNVLTDVVRSGDNQSLIDWLVAELPAVVLAQFLSIIPSCNGLSYAFEVLLARALADYPDPVIANWAGCRVAVQSSGMGSREAFAKLDESDRMTPISDELATQIRTAAPHRLDSILSPLLGMRKSGIAAALAKRPEPVDRDERVCCCVALLGSRDSVDEVIAGIIRSMGGQDEILQTAIGTLSSVRDHSRLGTLGLASMYRWEAAAFAFGDRSMKDEAECRAWLQVANDLSVRILQRDLVECLAHVLALYIARDQARAAALLTEAHLECWLERLPSEEGDQAAGVLMRAFKAKLNPQAFVELRDRAAEILPGLPESIKFRLRPWLDAANVGSMTISARVRKEATDADQAEQISRCTDLDKLAEWLRERNSGVVSDAAIRLLELGHAGIDRLVNALAENPPPRCASMITETISLWPEQTVTIIVQMIAGKIPLADSVRFQVALEALDWSWETEAVRNHVNQNQTLGVISDLLLGPCERSWVHVLDMQRLLGQLSEETKDKFAASWVDSLHPNVYRFAVSHQISRLNQLGESEHADLQDIEDSLRRFLMHGSDRDSVYRVLASVALANHGNWIGYPLLLGHRLSKEYGAAHDPFESLPTRWVPDELVVEASQSILMAGPSNIAESTVAELVDFHWSSENVVAAGNLLMRDAIDENLRQSIARLMRSDVHRAAKLRRIARVFQKGVRLGRQLTGKLFAVEMIGGVDFGYTKLNEDRVYINPMPLLNGTPHAEDIVEGLILHELGHHMYHRGTQQQAVWEEADSLGMGRLLNLVSDEHLERNLRALDRDYGDQLKRLGAYAFNRGSKEYGVDYILDLLGRHTADILQQHPPAVARDSSCLRVRGGTLLQELEKSGSSFTRFFRALRLGLGNRHDDPKVAAALALFGKGFRKLEMPQLLDICRRLHEIFGSESLMNRCPSIDDLVADPDGDLVIKADGITNEELQSEIQRINKKPSEMGSKSGPAARVINVGDDLHFDLITNIRKLAFHPDAYRPFAEQVASASRRFRDFLRDLGLTSIRVPRRIRGRQVDSARLKDLVLRGDPRVLVAREQRYHNDLFLSVVVDCSGSMDYGNNISKARLFAAMMAEACRGLAGVDLRLFGFTDMEIYDAGDACRPAVADLHAGGGNNDAAALWHAAEVASQSSRSAKVVVMISDGLPTECSTNALKALVARLSRRPDLVCAQVAVQPLEEICFPHYIELTDDDEMVSVRRFGSIVARLVKGIL